jgi:glutathione S-transferase
MFGQQTDDARVAENESSLKEKLKGYERILSKQKYLAGDVRDVSPLYPLYIYAHFDFTNKAYV